MTKKKKEIKVPMGRRFYLYRVADPSKISGLGFVSFGILLPSKKVLIEWIVGEHKSTEMHNSLEDLLAIHKHGNATEVIWIDPLETFITDLQ